jgi:hypothetical protein
VYAQYVRQDEKLKSLLVPQLDEDGILCAAVAVAIRESKYSWRVHLKNNEVLQFFSLWSSRLLRIKHFANTTLVDYTDV